MIPALHNEVLKAYDGSTANLAQSLDNIDLLLELERSKAAEYLAQLLRTKLRTNNQGILVDADIDECLADFHSDEVI